MTRGAYWNLYGSHSAWRAFQNLIWNWSMGMMFIASTVSYVERRSMTASFMLSGARGKRTGSGGRGNENPEEPGRYWLGAEGEASATGSAAALATAASTSARDRCAASLSGGGGEGASSSPDDARGARIGRGETKACRV